jgi:hypothetical protein|tara:strand:+ start:92 stop:625 length:534 start_codon:yes stop_codon:yes gene_type:complete
MIINIIEIQKKINSIFKIEDFDSILSELSYLEMLIKKDEDFVNDIYESLDDESQDVFTEILNYLDGAIYLCSIKKDSNDNLDNFFKLLSLGWTPDTYSEFEEFRALEYRLPVICETTDLFTMLVNESEDGDFDTLNDYLLENYESLNDFCNETIKEYYLDNINECISLIKFNKSEKL